MTILTDTLVEKGTIYETNSPTDQQINMTYNSQSYIYTHMTSGADPETLLTWGGGGGGGGGGGLSYGAIFSIMD